MTIEEANDIRLHLINSLERNGYGDIVREVNTKLEEYLESENVYNLSSHFLLNFYLEESINELESISNNTERISKITNKLNKYIESEQFIETVYVELIANNEIKNNETAIYDLKSLPDYQEIINELRDIREIIRSDN